MDETPTSNLADPEEPDGGAGAEGLDAASAGAATQPVASQSESVTQRVGSASGSVTQRVGSASESVSGSLSGALSGNVSGALSGDLSSESIAARRAAHGLAPETTEQAASKEEKRKKREESVSARQAKFKTERRSKAIRRTIIAVVVVLVLTVVVGFWLARWGLHDDASSLQGQWRVEGTDTVINITDKDIALNSEVSYAYVADTSAKTLSFSFGNLTGTGRYRFSLDHNRLSIKDGEFDWLSTFFEDVPWTFEAVANAITGDTSKSPALGQDDMVLVRVE